ncbi:hypothetical protein HPB50_022390 [Hyalomma asiaticum]|uniref:Uncharacterized protein n=1 Tax=Hyalomma asiaticum TaxID=266040 RepID=A0ACB7S5S1_HYAAI|nr:hypothetical protein HPB50_022390 [Hyalomma asiaticum]
MRVHDTCCPSPGASRFGQGHAQPSAAARTQRTTSRFSISRDFKIDDLHNEIKDLERRLKESERENKALKRVQARQERELLKAESARHLEGSFRASSQESERENKALKRVQARQERELLKAESARHLEGPDASRAHSEEIRALRALLAEGRDKLREYEKKLHLRNCELQKMRQALADLQRQIEEKRTLAEKEAEMQSKIEQLEREVQEKNTEVLELRRKLDAVQLSYKKELVKEKAQNKSFQKQMQALRADNELLQRKIKDASIQPIFLNHRDFLNHNGDFSDPKSIFMGMDQEKKERLLARLRDIDLSGTFVKSTAKRPRAARRLSMDSQQSRLGLKSTATNGLLPESLSSESSPTERMPPLGPNVIKARRMSDTLVRSRRGDSLSSILEMQALQIQSAKSEDIAENTNRRDCTESSISKETAEAGKREKLVFKDRQLAGKQSATSDVLAESFCHGNSGVQAAECGSILMHKSSALH